MTIEITMNIRMTTIITPTTDINLNKSSTVDVISEDTCKDLCEISKFGNFGDLLNLKDYSDCEQFLNAITVTQTDEQNPDTELDTEFKLITLNNKKQMIIKSQVSVGCLIIKSIQ